VGKGVFVTDQQPARKIHVSCLSAPDNSRPTHPHHKPAIAIREHVFQSEQRVLQHVQHYGTTTGHHNPIRNPASGGAASTQPTIDEDGQPGGHQRHHGGTRTQDVHGAAAAGPSTVGCLPVGVGGPHRRVPKGDRQRTGNNIAPQSVAHPQTADGPTDTGTEVAAQNHRTMISRQPDAHNTQPTSNSGRQCASNTSRTERPPTPEQTAYAGLHGQTPAGVPLAPPGETGTCYKNYPHHPRHTGQHLIILIKSKFFVF